MKMVKSLLLGSAAGLLALSGAQAADLPVKAKPVEYVKVCSAYGAGYFYVPGTDVCLRIGGYAFIEVGFNSRAGVPLIYSTNLKAGNILDRDVNRLNWRTRGATIIDARWASPIGTVRVYTELGIDYNNNLNGATGNTNTPYLQRAFMQFAGITAGFGESWFDLWPSGVYHMSMAHATHSWEWVSSIAYTATFGQGFSGTLALEDGQIARTFLRQGNNAACFFTAANVAAFPAGAFAPCNGYGGQYWPDVVANLRVDQAWGTAQISGALHQLRVNQNASLGLSTATPAADEWGYAALAGVVINLPMLASGSVFSIQAAYANGAVEYVGLNTSPGGFLYAIGQRNAAGFGPYTWVYDAAIGGFAANAPFERSTAWSVYGGLRHFFTPTIRGAITAGWARYSPAWHDNPAYIVPPAFRIWQVGLGVIWSPAPRVDLGLDGIWSNMQSGPCANVAAALQAAVCNQSRDTLAVSTRWRVGF